MGLGERLGVVMREIQLVVLAVKWGWIAGKHLVSDLQGLLQLFEAIFQRGEWQPQADSFMFVPGRADPRIGPAPGEHIQR